MTRLANGGVIDRQRPLRFTFNGKRYQGYEGDTLASALVANDVLIVGRSFKYHRPRGLLTCGPEEPNALVQLVSDGDQPNLRATEIPLREDLEARSVNCWPSAKFDLRAILERFDQPIMLKIDAKSCPERIFGDKILFCKK